MEDYYKAYDKRYRQVHEKGNLWASFIPTLEVMDIINKYGINNDSKILEIGCGEGRDSIYLLDHKYNVLGIDYSEEAISKCNEISNNKYLNKFRQFDIIEDKLDEKFDFIYSIAVLHMFVDDIHRKKFLEFVREHLTDNGIAFITVMGDGEEQYCSAKEDAFNDSKRININTDEEENIATTSCRIVDWEYLLDEISVCGLNVKSQWISDRIPDFNLSMCVVVGK